MRLEPRKIAVATAGFCAFLNLYSPQALLPALAREFGAGAAEISTIMTASALAIALTAPFTGAIADVLGRKRVITAAMLAVVAPMAGAALAADVEALIAWRFVQGLLLPPIFAVTVAYIGDEWPPSEVAGVAGVYVAGSSLGGFCGRFVPGVLGDLVGWRGAFLALAGLSFLGAVVVALLLPREKRFLRSEGLVASARHMLQHLRNPQLVATYAIGFGVLFNFIAVFTYVSFHLAAPPYNFSSTLLGAIFVTYLAGTAIAPATGWMMGRLGRRRFILAVLAAWACGALLTLAPPVAAILAGLVLCAVCGMLCQTISTGYVTASAQAGRSSAVGLYVTAFYIGGSMGAFLPGLAWEQAGWAGAIVMVLAVLAAMAVVATLAYRGAAA
ncbi:MAG TPA: MFS transporter [Xanthobacteraceae bacterium]|jgi:predicted MFS family arabinose efflux permease